MLKRWTPGLATCSFIFFVVLFSLWPELDIVVTGYFFDSVNSRFPANDNLFVQFVYWLFKEMPNVIVPLLVIASLITLFKNCPEKHRLNQRKWFFMLAFLLLGPGILVHTGFKDNWDRARPRDVTEFGGSRDFTSPLVISNQCEKNCSFVSGHAAMGFAYIALGWVLKSRLWLMCGVGLGLFVGGVRVMQGGHFLSDIIFSGYICYASAWVMARLILKERESDIQERSTRT